MPYIIDGATYGEIAERKFSADHSLNRFENRDYEIPHVRHSVQHTYSKNFGIIQFKADFDRDIKISGVRDTGHISLHFQRKGHSLAKFRDIKTEQPMEAGQYNMFFSEAYHSDLYFNCQPDFEYLAITFQKDYFLSVLEIAGAPLRSLEKSLRTGATFALSDKPMPTGPALNMALYSLLHSPVADTLSEMFINSKISEIIALQLSQYTGIASGRSVTLPDKTLEDVYRYIDGHFLTIHSPADAVKEFPVSEHQLKLGLKQHYNTTLYELLQRKRMMHAMQLLKETNMNVNEVAMEIGYSNATNFIQAFKRHFSVTPKQYKTHKT